MVIIFKSQKLPAMMLAWENLWEVFVLLLFIFDVVYHFQATLPCHRHSTLASQTREGLHQLWALPRLLLIAFSFSSTASATVLSGHFLPTGVFYLTLLPDIFGTTCFYQGLPGSQQFFLEVCRASYWSSKHRPGPSVCLIHSNPQSFIHLKFLFMHVNIAKVLLVVKTLIRSAATLFSNHENIKHQPN